MEGRRYAWAAWAALLLMASPAVAQQYPTKPKSTWERFSERAHHFFLGSPAAPEQRSAQRSKTQQRTGSRSTARSMAKSAPRAPGNAHGLAAKPGDIGQAGNVERTSGSSAKGGVTQATWNEPLSDSSSPPKGPAAGRLSTNGAPSELNFATPAEAPVQEESVPIFPRKIPAAGRPKGSSAAKTHGAATKRTRSLSEYMAHERP